MKRTSFTLFQEVQNVVLLSVNFLSPILFNSDLPNPGKYQSYAVPTDLEEISRVVNSVSDPVFFPDEDPTFVSQSGSGSAKNPIRSGKIRIRKNPDQ